MLLNKALLGEEQAYRQNGSRGQRISIHMSNTKCCICMLDVKQRRS